MLRALAATALLAAVSWAGADPKKGVIPEGGPDAQQGATLIRQDVTIHSRSAAGPDVKVPPPGPAPAVLQEVVESLDIYRNEHPGEVQSVKLITTPRRLGLPFPRPPYLSFTLKKDREFDWWRFEILEGDAVVWHAAGEGPLYGKLEWDGTGYTGAIAAKVGRPYRWSFTARHGEERFAAQSEPIVLRSMSYGEALGTGHMEVSNDLVFQPKSSVLAKESDAYLMAMANKLRASQVGDEPYRVILYHPDPDSSLARSRAAALQKYFSQYLVISATKVDVEVRSSRERGDVTACPLP